MTKAKPKGREGKEELVTKIRDAIGEFQNIFTFDYENFRTSNMKELRHQFEDSRFFMGNNKVIQIALGRTEEESQAPNLYKLSQFLNGHCGLWCTNRPKSEVKNFVNSYEQPDYARCKDVSTIDFTIPAGPLDSKRFPHNMEEYLRKLGLPVKLDMGVIVVTEEVEVAKTGTELSTEAAQILKLWDLQTVNFKLKLTGHWSNGVCRRIRQKEVTQNDDVSMQFQDGEDE
jgi:mRNA turnover protein 4